MTEHLFVYGTLAPGEPNEHVLGGLAGTWRPASVRGTLHSEGWGAAMGYPAILLDPEGEEVEGLLFSSKVLAEHWARLDRFEGAGYERVRTDVRFADGGEVKGWVYVLRGTSR